MPTFCYACETKLSDEDHATFDDPCPKCGNIATVSYPQGQEFAMRAGGIAVTSKLDGGGKWVTQSKVYHSHYKKDDEKHFIQPVIDRASDDYAERIVTTETGEVVREVHEALSDHQDRESAKKKE